MLLAPRRGALSQSIDEVLAALPDASCTGRSARRRTPPRSSSRPACTRTSPARSPSSPTLAAGHRERAATACGLAAAVAGHPPVRGVGRDGRRARRPPPGGAWRRCARSRAASRRSRCTCTSGFRTRRWRSRVAQPACARTCRCCSPSRPTRRTGRAATPGSRRRARRCSRPSRGSASRARFADFGDWADVDRPAHPHATRCPTPRTSGGTCARSRASARSRSGSWTPSPALDRVAAARRARAVARAAGGDGGPRRRRAPCTRQEVLDENRFLATRDGVDAAVRRPRVRAAHLPVA